MGVWIVADDERPRFVGAEGVRSASPPVSDLFRGTKDDARRYAGSSGDCALDFASAVPCVAYPSPGLDADAIIGMAGFGFHHAVIFRHMHTSAAQLIPLLSRALQTELLSDTSEGFARDLARCRFRRSARLRNARVEGGSESVVGEGDDIDAFQFPSMDVEWIHRHVADVAELDHGVLRRSGSGRLPEWRSLCMRASGGRLLSRHFSVPLRSLCRVREVVPVADHPVFPPQVLSKCIRFIRCEWLDGGASFEPLSSLLAGGSMVAGSVLAAFRDVDRGVVEEIASLYAAVPDGPSIARTKALLQRAKSIWEPWIQLQKESLGERAWPTRVRAVDTRRLGRYHSASNAYVPLEVGPSTLGRGSGSGLFAAAFIEAGTSIAFYRGVPLDLDRDDSDDHRHYSQQCNRAYCMSVTKNVVIFVHPDRVSTPERLARHPWCALNDPHGPIRGSTLLVNTKFAHQVRGGTPRIAIVTTKRVFPGEELFASYGPQYWQAHREACPRQ